VRLKRQELKEVTEEVGQLTARSEVLKFEVQRLEEKLAEKRRAEEMTVQMELDSFSEEEFGGDDGMETGFENLLTVSAADEPLFELGFGYEF